jgi:hypothetical protein
MKKSSKLPSKPRLNFPKKQHRKGTMTEGAGRILPLLRARARIMLMPIAVEEATERLLQLEKLI